LNVKLHINEPSALATYLTTMSDAKELLKEKGQNKLARTARADLDTKCGVHHSVVAVNKIITDLPAQVPNVAERAFLNEALKWYRIEAYRACIVMTWDLAYGHLLDWILKEPIRLAAFNAAISKRYQKMTSTANLFNSNIFKFLKERLDKRNITAHPSTVTVCAVPSR
jgi:hypothetical protein